MICSWLIYALFNDKIGIWEALIIGAALTPTDPVVAASVASGNLAEEYLPERLTSTISLESGANDGLAYPFVFLGIVFLQEDSTSDAVERYFVDIWILDVIVLAVSGFATGIVLGLLMDLSRKKNWADKSSLFAISLAITLFVLGVFRLAKFDAILGVFLAGIAFSVAVRLKEKAEEESVQDSVDLLITNIFFLLFGTILPFSDWYVLL
jgi:NhaP-type Na+/H+ or K+/H+ antiporter